MLQKGDAVTPKPSKEFLMIRSMLKPYAVADPKEACIVFPGVDFLSLHRFPSLEMAHYVAAVISERFYNVLIFTLIGEWSHTFRQIMASSVTPRHVYRHRLDISLPPLLPYYRTRKEQKVVKHNLLVLMMNASAAFKEECLETFGKSKEVMLVYECSDQPQFSCDLNGNRVDWSTLCQESKFILIHERIPIFKIALFKALESTSIPIIFTPNYVLPFSDYIDWHLISLRPSSLSRVLDVINSLDDNRVQALRNQIQTVFKDFSSVDRIVNMTLKVLEARMLPLKARTYEQWNKLPDQ
ncbi:exostosin family protein, partial [Oesophagostomum dentatum]